MPNAVGLANTPLEEGFDEDDDDDDDTDNIYDRPDEEFGEDDHNYE